MKNVWILACLLACGSALQAQVITSDTVSVAAFVQDYPTYGTDADWQAYLSKKRDLATAYRDVDAAGRAKEQKVWVRVWVDKSGTVTRVRPIGDAPASLTAEAVRLVKASGSWRPALRQGKTVKGAVSLAITFPPYPSN
ncbi:energy transducer TonB [Flaviaesturariibacter amylovorans]|uniref:TonB C-terminal domain-containing protein n=1 Tax=Flaviaesturariibacter amylovorans TaxID=1084520 RepID=A0ABP8G8C1_9BACT